MPGRASDRGRGPPPPGRVGGVPCSPPPPSEPYVRLSPYTAQARHRHFRAKVRSLLSVHIDGWLRGSVYRDDPRIQLTPHTIASPLPAMAYLAHVSILSDWVSPYRAGYEFPVPFGCPPSLPGPSCPAGGFAAVAVGLLSCRVPSLLSTRPPSGLSRSASSRCDWGGRPFYSGVLVSSSGQEGFPDL